MQPKASLFGHKTPVVVMAVSKSFSTLLTASSDGMVILWDLNRLEFVRKLPQARGIVECASINDVTGDIMLCRGQKVSIYTLNGELLVEHNVATTSDDYIASCAWYEGAGNEWIESDLCFTGQRRGVVNCWKKVVGNDGKWQLELAKRLDHVDSLRRGNENGMGATAVGGRSSSGSMSGSLEAAITCVTPMPQALFTGDEDGRVVSSLHRPPRKKLTKQTV
jgi:WD40 repeat protein